MTHLSITPVLTVGWPCSNFPCAISVDNALNGNVSPLYRPMSYCESITLIRPRIGSLMEPDDVDKGQNPNLATTLASIAIDTAKLITGVPLDYPDPLLTPLANVPQPAKEEPFMDDEKKSQWSIR
jgi:hypothetical protein